MGAGNHLSTTGCAGGVLCVTRALVTRGLAQSAFTMAVSIATINTAVIIYLFSWKGFHALQQYETCLYT